MTHEVAVFGGGVGGLTVAHELARVAKDKVHVTVYERNTVTGGKARSFRKPGTEASGQALPGEHGFRFFPGYYKHVVDTMARIPYGSNRNGVKDNLVFGRSARFSRKDALDIEVPYRRLYEAEPSDLVEALIGFLGVAPGLGLTELTYFATRILEFVTSEYDVDFPMFAKIEVNGDGACELYRLLKAAQPGDGDSPDITWNFEKFLIDREGNVVRRFAPPTTPEQLVEIVP